MKLTIFFRELTMKPLSFSRIHSKSFIVFTILLWINHLLCKLYLNSQWFSWIPFSRIHYLFCNLTKKSQFFSQNHFYQLYFSLILLLFCESTIKSLAFSRTHYLKHNHLCDHIMNPRYFDGFAWILFWIHYFFVCEFTMISLWLLIT